MVRFNIYLIEIDLVLLKSVAMCCYFQFHSINTVKFTKNNDALKKSKPNEYIVYDSIYIKPPNRKLHSLALEGSSDQKGHRASSKILECCMFLPCTD